MNLVKIVHNAADGAEINFRYAFVYITVTVISYEYSKCL